MDLILANPIIAASGTFGCGLEFAPFGDLSTLGGISVKGISLLPREGNPPPRIMETPAGMLNSIGLQNDGVEAFLANKLPHLPWENVAIIANLYATSVGDFGDLAAIFADDNRIAALEVNVSCPNVAAGGMAFGADRELCGAVVEAVRKNAPHKHVMVKLSPNVTNISDIARAAEGAGADSISCINTLLGMGIDLETRKPALANVLGGLSGPAIKPVALRCVWQVSHAVSIPVIGLGGIVSADDILEFFCAGASAVQVGTASFMNPAACFELAASLPNAIVRHGGKKLADFHRAAHSL